MGMGAARVANSKNAASAVSSANAYMVLPSGVCLDH